MYFRSVIQQDWKQLREQPNSVCGPNTARDRYASLKLLESLIPEMTHTTYNHGPYKLICDDLGPANMLVQSQDDLTIIGVVDLEWVYAGPAQLFASAPWWLLVDRPVNEEWDFNGDEAPEVTDRYFKHLEIFKRVLEEEESKMLEMDKDTKKISELMKWSEDSGAMWFHMLVSCGFFDSSTFPCMQLRKHKGAEWWTARLGEYEETEEVKTFAENKPKDLELYDEIGEKVEQYQALVDKQEMEVEKFINSVSALLISD